MDLRSHMLHDDIFEDIGPLETLGGFIVLLFFFISFLFCVGYCCCFTCDGQESY